MTAGGQLLNLGHGIFQKVVEKVMESHGILTSHKCTNLVTFFLPQFEVIYGLLLNRGTAKWNLFVVKIDRYFFSSPSDRWNKLDVVSVVTYLIILMLRLTTWIASESVKTNRAVLVAGYLYSFNTLCLTLRISHVVETFKGLGTIQIALFNVLQDVFTIIWQFIAAVFAFSVAITKIYMAEKSFHASESNQQNL